MPKTKKLKKAIAADDAAVDAVDAAIEELPPEAAERLMQAMGLRPAPPVGDYTPAQMAKIVSESSQLADHYRRVASMLVTAVHRALHFLNTENPTEGDRLMARNALMAACGYEEPKEWRDHWVYNHTRPSHAAVLDTINQTLFQSARKGQLAEAAVLPDLFYRYVYEAVCWTDGREPNEETPSEFRYMGVTYRPASALAAELGAAA